MIQFTFNGFWYRFDGKVVEAKDGDSWNQTGSLPVYLEAKRLSANKKRRESHMAKQIEGATPKTPVVYWLGELVEPAEIDESGFFVTVKLPSTGKFHTAHVNELSGFRADMCPQVR